MLAAATVGALLLTSAPPGSAQTANQQYSALGSGSVISTNALQAGSTQVAGVHAAVSGGAVNSRDGLGGPQTSELGGQNINPALPDKNAYGRGTGLELGAVTPIPQGVDVNQLILSGLAQASAPPPSPLVTKEIPLALNPIAFASTLRGQAQATFDPNFCPIGKPLTYGLGAAENLQILNTGGTNADGSFQAPALGTSITTGTPRAVSQSRTFTYLFANGDGTFGLASETRQTVAPISLGTNPLTGGLLTLEVAGEFVMRAVATGKPGGARIEYSGNPVITLKLAGVAVPPTPLRLQDVVGAGGLPLNLSPIANLQIGTPPHAIKNAGGAKVESGDGTTASAAVDAVRVTLLPLAGITAADIGVGHIEAAVNVPAGGIKCQIPVSKTVDPDPVLVGNVATYRISIPNDAAFFASLFDCDLIGISATDLQEVQSGNPRFQFISADHGGVIAGNKITWSNLGNYKLGDPPIVLVVQAKILSGSGVLRDTVDVSATLGNCRGGAVGADLVGQARLDGSAIAGKVTLVGPNVGRGNLPPTGGTSLPLAIGGGLVLLAMGGLRLRRRAMGSTL